MARQQGKEAEALRAIRDQVLTVFVPKLSALVDELNGAAKRLNILRSVAHGLYDELDKLCKKAPAEPLTSLALQQVNDAIEEGKALGPDDAHLQKLKQFVPAGDNPEQRDAVMVLRLLQQGLERASGDLERRLTMARQQLGDARALEVAIDLRLEGSAVTKDALEYNGVEASRYWRIGQDYNYAFDFERLNHTDLSDFFSLAK